MGVSGPSSSQRFFTFFAVLVLAGALGLLGFGEYTRKTRINGWLVPHDGIVRVLAQRPGVIAGLHVAEGAVVHKGDKLVTLSDEVQSRLGATQEQITRLLAQRSASLLDERRQRERMLAQRQEALVERTEKLRAELAQVDQEIALRKSRVAIAERAESQHKQLRQLGLIADLQLQQAEADTLEQRTRLGEVERAKIANERDLASEEASLRALPLEFSKDFAA